jgi:hypothetical protein
LAVVGFALAMTTCTPLGPVATLAGTAHFTLGAPALRAAGAAVVDVVLPQVDALLMASGGALGLLGSALLGVGELGQVAHRISPCHGTHPLCVLEGDET